MGTTLRSRIRVQGRLGIIAIFSIGQGVEATYRPLVMGLTFAIALTLVVFAGAELFTGHTMIMAVGLMRGTVGLGSVAKSWTLTWIGNLIGAAGLAALFWLGGDAILKQGADFAFTAANAKMHARCRKPYRTASTRLGSRSHSAIVNIQTTTIPMPPDLHQTLERYAECYREIYGEAEKIADLVPFMLVAFLASDKDFAKVRKGGSSNAISEGNVR